MDGEVAADAAVREPAALELLLGAGVVHRIEGHRAQQDGKAEAHPHRHHHREVLRRGERTESVATVLILGALVHPIGHALREEPFELVRPEEQLPGLEGNPVGPAVCEAIGEHHEIDGVPSLRAAASPQVAEGQRSDPIHRSRVVGRKTAGEAIDGIGQPVRQRGSGAGGCRSPTRADAEPVQGTDPEQRGNRARQDRGRQADRRYRGSDGDPARACSPGPCPGAEHDAGQEARERPSRAPADPCRQGSCDLARGRASAEPGDQEPEQRLGLGVGSEQLQQATLLFQEPRKPGQIRQTGTGHRSGAPSMLGGGGQSRGDRSG